MRQNPAAATTKLREKMGKFVAQGAINFDLAVIG